jgi:hypothetical protein
MGIDPGLTGAACVLDRNSGKIIELYDLPTYTTETKARKSGEFKHLDVHKLSKWVDMYADACAVCVLEDPGAMPKQGLSSTFRFGKTCGEIHGVLAGHYVMTIPVKPSAWKAFYGLSSNKDSAKQLADEIFPSNSALWSLKKFHDRAEAAILAFYGVMYLKTFLKL